MNATTTRTRTTITTTTTGMAISTIAEQLTLAEASDVDVFAARWAPAFFLWLGTRASAAAREDDNPTRRRAHPTFNARSPLDLPRAQSAIEERSELFVFPVRRRVQSELAFVSVGRLAGNDIAIRDDTISKFHAYLKPDASGSFTLLQDGRSRNGTFVDCTRVARRGEGEPVPLHCGQHVRFGSVSMSYLDAASVLQLVRAFDCSRAATRAHPFPRASFAATPAYPFPSLLSETTRE